MSRYPFNERWVQLDPTNCPAPFCGREIHTLTMNTRLRMGLTMQVVTYVREPFFMPIDGEMENRKLDHNLITCYRAACLEWAEMRAGDISYSADVNGSPSMGPSSMTAWRMSVYFNFYRTEWKPT